MDPPLKNILNELRGRFQALYGDRLVRMIVYGSQARGQAAPDSDIDVLVILKAPVVPCAEIARTEDIVAGISLSYDRVIACVFISAEEFAHQRSPFLLNVRREGVFV